jgi:hypothetical protein
LVIRRNRFLEQEALFINWDDKSRTKNDIKFFS